MNEITLEPGSVAERFVAYLRAHPGEYDRHGVAAVLSIAPGAVDVALQPAVDVAVITIANSVDVGRVWRAGPRMGAWKLAPAALAALAAPPQTATAQAPRAEKRGGKRRLLPVLDVGKLTIGTSAPLPPNRFCQRGATRHDAIFDSLTADGMSVTGIAMPYMAALMKAVQAYLQQRPALKSSAYLVRRIDDDTCGVWRVARPGAAPGSAAAPQPERKRLQRAA